MDKNEELDVEFEKMKSILSDPEAVSLPQEEPDLKPFVIPEGAQTMPPLWIQAEAEGDAAAQDMEINPEQEPSQEDSGTGKRKKEDGSWQKSLLLWLHDLVYLLAALVLISPLLFRVVVVSGTSMNRTLLDGDYLVVLSNSLYQEPEYEDIVVISKKSFDNGAPIVKRVIATAGQWVDIDFDTGIVYVGEALDSMVALVEPYTTTPTTMQEGMKFPLQVPADSVFVLGDNRAVSKDSRHPDIGIIHEQEILGKVFLLFLPGTNGTDANRRPLEERDWGRLGFVE